MCISVALRKGTITICNCRPETPVGAVVRWSFLGHADKGTVRVCVFHERARKIWEVVFAFRPKALSSLPFFSSSFCRQPVVYETTIAKNRVASRLAFDDDSCGKQSYIPKIRGGQLAEIDEFPWMAMLLYVRGNDRPVQGCGGALISRTFVITAAHCVTGRKFQQAKGRLAYVRLREYNTYTNPDCVYENDLKDCSEDMIDLTPKDIIPHPMYDGDSSSQEHDIALIRIDETPSFNDFLRSICLPELSYENGPSANKRLSVSGWGRTDLFKGHLRPDEPSPIKLKLLLPYVNWNQCSKTFGPWQFRLGPGQMCAGGEPGMDTCAGDSGSPLMSYDMQRGVWNITGIVSLGVQNCGVEGLPGVYTNVHHYVPWIRQYVGAY